MKKENISVADIVRAKRAKQSGLTQTGDQAEERGVVQDNESNDIINALDLSPFMQQAEYLVGLRALSINPYEAIVEPVGFIKRLMAASVSKVSYSPAILSSGQDGALARTLLAFDVNSSELTYEEYSGGMGAGPLMIADTGLTGESLLIGHLIIAQAEDLDKGSAKMQVRKVRETRSADITADAEQNLTVSNIEENRDVIYEQSYNLDKRGEVNKLFQFDLSKISELKTDAIPTVDDGVISFQSTVIEEGSTYSIPSLTPISRNSITKVNGAASSFTEKDVTGLEIEGTNVEVTVYPIYLTAAIREMLLDSIALGSLEPFMEEIVNM